MRLLHVVATGSRRGAELFASDLVRALGRTDVDQRIAVLRSPIEPGLRYDASVSLLGGDGRGVPGIGIDLMVTRRLRSLIEAWRPDVVQAHGGETLKNSVVATVGRDAPLVYRRIGVAAPWMTRLPRRPVYAGLMRRAARIVTVAEAVREETVRLFGIAAPRVVTIPNGVDPDRMRTTSTRREMRLVLGIPPESPVTVTLGALVWEKDPFAHLEVASRVLGRMPTAVHLFVGDGPLRSRLEAAIRARGLSDRVMLLGSRVDVADILAVADVLLFASRRDGMEGMPASLIEAGMAGLPVVAHAIAGVPEIVVDGETGFLAPPRDTAGLADRVLQLLEDEQARAVMGQAARERCRSRFDIEPIASRYLSVYEQVLSSRSSQARV